MCLIHGNYAEYILKPQLYYKKTVATRKITDNYGHITT